MDIAARTKFLLDDTKMIQYAYDVFRAGVLMEPFKTLKHIQSKNNNNK